MAEPKGFLMVPVGFNPSGDLRTLELDANDYLKVALAAWLEGAVDVKGYTGAAWKELLVNASGQAIVVGKGTSEEVNAALLAPARGLVGEHGYIGGAWQKQPMLPGFSGRVLASGSNLNLPAGTSSAVVYTVPVSHYIRLTQVNALVVSATVTRVSIGFSGGGSSVDVLQVFAPVSIQVYLQTIDCLLGPGDTLYYGVSGATLGDDIYWAISAWDIVVNL